MTAYLSNVFSSLLRSHLSPCHLYQRPYQKRFRLLTAQMKFQSAKRNLNHPQQQQRHRKPVCSVMKMMTCLEGIQWRNRKSRRRKRLYQRARNLGNQLAQFPCLVVLICLRVRGLRFWGKRTMQRAQSQSKKKKVCFLSSLCLCLSRHTLFWLVTLSPLERVIWKTKQQLLRWLL